MQIRTKQSELLPPDVDSVDYSIVIPVYFNQGSLRTTLASLKNEVINEHLNLSCEVIFIDDGSGDGSLDELLEIQSEYPDLVKIIKLTRNFGQPRARLAGLSYANGHCVITMSADGQDPPSLINKMLKAYYEEGYNVVACVRTGRDESLFRIITSRIFYKVMRKLRFPNMPSGGFDFVLLGRPALDVVLRNQDSTPFFQGQVLWTGYPVKFIKYHRMKRRVGQSKWTLAKKVMLLLDGVLGYSFVPIRVMTLLGLLTAFVGFVYALWIAIRRIVIGVVVAGYVPMMIVILLMGGMQMVMLGIIGEYLWRVLAEVRNRDLYVVDTIYDNTR